MKACPRSRSTRRSGAMDAGAAQVRERRHGKPTGRRVLAAVRRGNVGLADIELDGDCVGETLRSLATVSEVLAGELGKVQEAGDT